MVEDHNLRQVRGCGVICGSYAHSTQVHELYAHALDGMNRDRLVMKMQPGKSLEVTQQYLDLGNHPNDRDCLDFFSRAYTALFEDAKNYIAQYAAFMAGRGEYA